MLAPVILGDSTKFSVAGGAGGANTTVPSVFPRSNGAGGGGSVGNGGAGGDAAGSAAAAGIGGGLIKTTLADPSTLFY